MFFRLVLPSVRLLLSGITGRLQKEFLFIESRLRYLFELVLSEPALNEKELLLKAACDARKEQPDGGQNQTEKQ